MMQKVFVLFAVLLGLAARPSQPAAAQESCDPNAPISRISVSSAATEGNNTSANPTLSDDGLYAAFTSLSTNLVGGDTNNASDIFLYDFQNCTTTLASIATNGTQGNAASELPALSGDGLSLGFSSYSNNFVAQDTNGRSDVFVRSRLLNQTTRTSVGTGNTQATGDSFEVSLSADGRYALFFSSANNLVAGDNNATLDAFIRDRNTATTTRIVGTGGVQPNGHTFIGAISGDGNYVAFASDASNLVAGDTNSGTDVFLYNRATGAITKITTTDASGASTVNKIDLSYDGRYIVYDFVASDIVANDTNSTSDVFIYDRTTAETTRLSVSTQGTEGDGASFNPSISNDGRFVVFESEATNLVADDENGVADIFLRDRLLNTTVRVSTAADGTEGNADSGSPVISGDGRLIAFESNANNLVSGDGNSAQDIFVVNRLALLNDGNMLTNGDFSANLLSWIPFGAPTPAALQYQLTSGVLEFYRATGTQQALVMQNTGLPLAANTNFEASVSLGNSSTIRKRISVLVHDSDFTDLQICTFWLPPNTPMGEYRMTARTTEAWTNTSISIYASSADGLGWAQVDDVALKVVSGPTASRTMCHDPLVTPSSPDADGANLLTNGDFSAGFNSWINYGTPTLAALNYQVTGGVLEFSRNAGTQSAIVYQSTGADIEAGTHLEISFSMGNSSALRKRATVLIHEGDFTDLHVCTFWLPPNAPLSTYTIRTYATKAWTNATLSFYASTADGAGWYQLDDVVFRTRPSTTIAGTECYGAGVVPVESLELDSLPSLEVTETPSVEELPQGELPIIATPQPFKSSEDGVPQEGSAGDEFSSEGG
jgi:hypothetical protein